MIGLLDKLLRDLLSEQISELKRENQISFQPPDEDWSRRVNGTADNCLNIYLVDLRENRKLRSNEQVRLLENGGTTSQPRAFSISIQFLLRAC